VFQGIPSTAVRTGQNIDVTVPREAFGHSSSRAVVQLDAVRSNGQPLPEWLDFDPTSGKFSGKPPRNAEAVVEIKVIARDNEGREVATTFTIRVGDTTGGAAQPRGTQAAAPDAPFGERVVVADAGDAAQGDEKAAERQQRRDARDGEREPPRERVRVAAMSFSEQLNRARQDALLTRIMEVPDREEEASVSRA